MLQEPNCATVPLAARKRRRVLVVEDMSTMREIMMSFLAKAGFEVDGAADGMEALSLLASEKYDLVMMDVHMPGIDGITAAHTIREHDGPNRSVPILAVTAETSPERLHNILDAGMEGFLCKPFGQAQLMAAVNPWLLNEARL